MDAAQNYLRGLLKVTFKGIITAPQNGNYLQTPGWLCRDIITPSTLLFAFVNLGARLP
jgi:hypothetical protein